CTLWGVALGLRALWPAEPSGVRRVRVVAATGCELLAYWLILAMSQVAVVEAYTVPAAAVALLAGWLAVRSRPGLRGWTAYGAAGEARGLGWYLRSSGTCGAERSDADVVQHRGSPASYRQTSRPAGDQDGYVENAVPVELQQWPAREGTHAGHGVQQAFPGRRLRCRGGFRQSRCLGRETWRPRELHQRVGQHHRPLSRLVVVFGQLHDQARTQGGREAVHGGQGRVAPAVFQVGDVGHRQPRLRRDGRDCASGCRAAVA